MGRVVEGKLDATGKRFAIVVGRFNSFVSSKLLSGAMDCLLRHNADEDSIDIFWVPGAFEIPVMAKKLAGTGKYDAIIALGAVIRGETPHFEYVASEVAKGIALVSLEREVPVAFGIVTADTMDQAVDRAGAKSGNKGFDAAMTAIEMANLWAEI